MTVLEVLSQSPVGEIVVTILGLVWGSFFNVCIYRLPKDESVIFPRSKCPHCSGLIPWFHNIPVISFIVLRGRCASCDSKISIEYPLVEVATALMFLGLYVSDGWSRMFLSRLVFFSGLWISSVVDLHHKIIPDQISVGGIPIGFLFALWVGNVTWFESLGGIVAGGGSFLSISWVYEKLTKREGLGGGDVKLLAMIGAWLGIQGVLPVIIISSAIGSVVGVTWMVLCRKGLKEAIPFGPFLALGAVFDAFWHDEIAEYLFPY